MSMAAAMPHAIEMMSGSTFVMGPLIARVMGLLTPEIV
jgi:hypothetical protein